MHVNSEKIGFTINSQIKNGSKTCPSYKVINGFYTEQTSISGQSVTSRCVSSSPRRSKESHSVAASEKKMASLSG